MLTMIGGGMRNLNEAWRPMQDCIGGMSKWIEDAAVKFDPANNLVYTAKNNEIQYEYMIVATGLQLNYAKVSIITMIHA